MRDPLKEPQFGDVFRFRNGDYDYVVLWLCHAPQRLDWLTPDYVWHGFVLATDGESITPVGEVGAFGVSPSNARFWSVV